MLTKLRELEIKDIDGMLEWMHDPSINCFFRFDGNSMTYEKALLFIQNKQQYTKHYAIVDENDEYLGTISLKDIDLVNKKAEYAISVRKKYHGKGISTQASDMLMHVAKDIGLHRIYLNVLSKNKRAIAFYKKYGFIYEGCSKDDVCINGIYHDLLWFAKILEEKE